MACVRRQSAFFSERQGQLRSPGGLRWIENRDSEGTAGAKAAAVTERRVKSAQRKQPAREAVICTDLFCNNSSNPKIIATRLLVTENGSSRGILMLDEYGKIHCNGDATPLFQCESSLHPECKHLQIVDGQSIWVKTIHSRTH